MFGEQTDFQLVFSVSWLKAHRLSTDEGIFSESFSSLHCEYSIKVVCAGKWARQEKIPQRLAFQTLLLGQWSQAGSGWARYL